MAARKALAAGDADLVLPFVPAAAEPEARAAFASARQAIAQGGAAAPLAERWFFETVVRLHRAGEGAPYTGLKPAGLGFGPIVPLAEKALETGDLVPLYKALSSEMHSALHARFEGARALRAFDPHDVAAARAYTSAMLGFQVWAHGLHTAIAVPAGAHAVEAAHAH